MKNHWLYFLVAAHSIVWVPPSSAAPETANRFALLVGVSGFESPNVFPNPSVVCENEIEDFGQLLTKQLGFPPAQVKVLTTARGKREPDQAPTASNIIRSLELIRSEKGRDDFVLLAFSMPGGFITVENPDKNSVPKTFPFLLPTDADYSGINPQDGSSKRLINLDTILNDFSRCNAGFKVVMVNSPLADIPSKCFYPSQRIVPTVPYGVNALFACRVGEKVLESPLLGSGRSLFFHHVLEGLGGGVKPDTDGGISVADLAKHIQQNVPLSARELVGVASTQNPQCTVSQFGSVFFTGGSKKNGSIDRSEKLRKSMEMVVDYPGIDVATAKVSEELDNLGKQYGISFEFNEFAFRAAGIEKVRDNELGDPIPRMKAPLRTVVDKLIARTQTSSLEGMAVQLLRGDTVQITTYVDAASQLLTENPSIRLSKIYSEVVDIRNKIEQQFKDKELLGLIEKLQVLKLEVEANQNAIFIDLKKLLLDIIDSTINYLYSIQLVGEYEMSDTAEMELSEELRKLLAVYLDSKEPKKTAIAIESLSLLEKKILKNTDLSRRAMGELRVRVRDYMDSIISKGLSLPPIIEKP